MKRAFCILFAAMLLFGLFSACAKPSKANIYDHPRFALELPENWERVDSEGVLSFAERGDAVNSSCLTFYVTEKSPYFDELTADDYETYAPRYTGFSSVSNVEKENIRIDGWKAHRVSMKAKADGKTVSIVFYAVDAEQTLFFVVLQRSGDNCIEFFDSAMKRVDIKKYKA